MTQPLTSLVKRPPKTMVSNRSNNSLNPQSLKPLNIRVPATTANLGPGFDSFGLALALYNRFKFEAITEKNTTSTIELSDATCIEMTKLSLVPEENLVYQSFAYYFKQQQIEPPQVKITIEGHIPLARGLGSSSTAIAAGLFAANVWNNNHCNTDILIQYATAIEGHPDNVAPALAGGCRLCDGEEAYLLDWPRDWQVIIVVPQYPLLTEKARSVMPNKVSIPDAVFNLRKSSLLTYAIVKNDGDALSQALTDKLHQPYRKTLIPEFERVEAIAKQHNAYGTVISGAGPSLAIFCDKALSPSLIQTLKQDAQTLSAPNPPFKVLPLAIDNNGTHLDNV